ncbi:carbohydrate deacetylase [Chryseobacterium gwangjuense]|uniref:carbohydrate deacetylase n=1 Tax=Chryseobacterium gwangjuense TaxID=1069980 RepID=UPI001E4914B9|nr:ChbG/HpnK family deacetylase [Chryseobacterium gwangjuense]MCE3075428.1 ChbG/HpnK family deacetylase [Chryseobacterium gwangjuense]
MKSRLIINADDLGFTKGINEAIKKAHLEGFLSHASLMANMPYFEEAVEEVIGKCPNLKVGVHVNLTCGKALYKDNLLAKNSEFRNSFVSLLFTFKSQKVLTHIEKEIESQILAIRNKGIEISHIDGHEHIHVIPSINKIVRKLAKKYNIPRIREINENFRESFKYNGRTASKANYIKLLLLKFLSQFNADSGKVKFYSILNTCEINSENLFSYLENSHDEQVEIMLHPSLIELDKNEKNLDSRFIDFLNSPYRTQEFELCFHAKFKDYL